MADTSEDQRFEQDCAALLKQIDALTTEQRKIWDEVEGFIADNDDVAQQVELIGDARNHQLQNAQEKASQLAKAIADSAKTAKTSSRRVKEMDVVKARVNGTLDLANGISKQRSSIEGIGEALAKYDYECAADYIASYCEIERQLQDIAQLEDGDGAGAGEVLHDSTDSEDEDLVEVQKSGTRATSKMMRKKREEVRSAVRSEFNTAACNGDRDGVFRFSKLFRKLGLEEEGRVLYCKWLRMGCGSQLKKHVESTLERIEAGTGESTHLRLVSDVLDHVVIAMESEEEHVKEYFGREGVVTMITALHQECTVHSVNILDSFLSANELSPTPSPAGGGRGGGASPTPPASHRGSTAGADAGPPGGRKTPKDMDKTLDEISHLSHFCYLYFQFIRDRAEGTPDAAAVDPPAGDGDAAKDAPTPPPASITAAKPKLTLHQFSASDALGSAKLFGKLQALLGCYLPLQREYIDAVFDHSITVAFKELDPQAAAAPPPGGATKNAFEKGFENLTSGKQFNLTNLNLLQNFGYDERDDLLNLDAPLYMVDDIFAALRKTCDRVIRTKSQPIICGVACMINAVISERLHTVVTERLRVRKDASRVPKGVLCWVNVVQVVMDYMKKLSGEFGQLLVKQFGPEEGKSDSFLVSLQEFVDTGAMYEKALQTVVQQAAGVISRQMFERGLTHFEQLSYVLGEEKLMHYEINDAWVRAAIVQWQEVLGYYKEVLNPETYSVLVVELVGWTTKQMEDLVMKKQFDLCGGLQLDRDVRAVKQYFSGQTENPVREKFTKLSHIATLLIVDKLSEVEDLWSSTSSGLMWRLTPSEAQKVLLLRSDLPKTAVQALNLAKAH